MRIVSFNLIWLLNFGLWVANDCFNRVQNELVKFVAKKFGHRVLKGGNATMHPLKRALR